MEEVFMTMNALARNLLFSNRVIRVVTRDARLAPRAKLLACVIASLDGGEDRSATMPIGKLCGVSAKTLIAARRELEQQGYLQTCKVSGRIVSYRLSIPTEVSA
jgi:hypothetical protein